MTRPNNRNVDKMLPQLQYVLGIGSGLDKLKEKAAKQTNNID